MLLVHIQAAFFSFQQYEAKYAIRNFTIFLFSSFSGLNACIKKKSLFQKKNLIHY